MKNESIGNFIEITACKCGWYHTPSPVFITAYRSITFPPPDICPECGCSTSPTVGQYIRTHKTVGWIFKRIDYQIVGFKRKIKPPQTATQTARTD